MAAKKQEPKERVEAKETPPSRPKKEQLEGRRTMDRRRQESPSSRNPPSGKQNGDRRRQQTPSGKESEPWDILMYPHLAEKSMKMVEAENKLVFMVRRSARKGQIKEAVEKAFDVKVTKVNFEITMAGQKKAYVKLSPESSASDIATRMGMV